MVAQTQALLAPIDFLVNNAGSAGVIGPIWETDPDDWWREVEVNLRGPLLCARAVLPGMIARRRGRIVNMASGVGLTPFPYTSAYACSKVALIRLTDCAPGGHRAAWCDGVRDQSRPGADLVGGQDGEFRGSSTMDSPGASRLTPITPTCRGLRLRSIADLCVRLARGDGDALAGRFIHVLYDFDEMRARADEIARDDLYQLRLRTLPPR